MSNYVITLFWVNLIFVMGIYWHTLKINKNIRKLVEHFESESGSGE
ncbi:MAG: hypothetical protein IIB39_04620 [Candidatus Marinimicrobia bacterium]|nr:hypothetical protein [Candidatus Neomarinimicrobiota bacterium]